MSDTAILQRLDSLTAAFVAMSRLVGARLTRTQMCERLGISSKTLTDRVKSGEAPRPLPEEGKWLLANVVEWEWQQMPTIPSFVVRERGHHLYRHFDEAGTLLYVGISISAIGRMAGHKTSSPWVWSIARMEVQTFPTREEAMAAEKAAIQTEHPLFNALHGDKFARAVSMGRLQ